MVFKFTLSQKGMVKNINLNIYDEREKIDYNFRTSLKIKEEDWDKEKQRPRNIYLKENKKINNKLDNIKKELTEFVDIKLKDKKHSLQRTLSKEIKKICSQEEPFFSEGSFLYYMNWYITSKKELISFSTFKRYNVFFRMIQRFEGTSCKVLYIRNIDSDFIKDFVIFGKNEEYSENTTYRTIHFVKTILNFAERKGIRTNVRELEMKREVQRRKVITLTENELMQIKSTEVPDDLKAAKDWLLISCYTGQRFSDFINFNNLQLKNIDGKKCIGFVQKKTKKNILLPLHPTVLNTISRNGNNFPEMMDIQHYNIGIRRVAKLANLNELIKARKRLGHRTKEVETEKWKLLSSHIGRRSFATNFYGKIPTPLLMEATGHSTEKMFLKYINMEDASRVLSLGNYFDKMYKERKEN